MGRLVLIDEIISLATTRQTPISDLLRKCVVLAYQLKNGRLKTWANQELNGYKSGDSVPEHRKTLASAKGNFVTRFGGQMTARNIPPAAMEEGHRWAAETVALTQPVSAYENMPTEDGVITYPWHNDLILYYQQRLLPPDWALLSAWQEVPDSCIAGVLDTIRTRVLNMGLEIRAEIRATDAT